MSDEITDLFTKGRIVGNLPLRYAEDFLAVFKGQFSNHRTALLSESSKGMAAMLVYPPLSSNEQITWDGLLEGKSLELGLSLAA